METHIFTIILDNDALKYILNLPDVTGKLRRWQLLLSKSESDLGHRSGTKSEVADALLRLNTGGTDSTYLNDESPKRLVPLIEHKGEKVKHDHD